MTSFQKHELNSFRFANRNKEYKLKSYNRWYWYLAIVLGYSLIGHALIDIRGDVFGYELYRLSSKSMAPDMKRIGKAVEQKPLNKCLPVLVHGRFTD